MSSNFAICSEWQLDALGRTDRYGNPMWVIDVATEKRYLNIESSSLRSIMLDHFVSGCCSNAYGAVQQVVIRILKLGSCYYFWPDCNKTHELIDKEELDVPFDAYVEIGVVEPKSCSGRVKEVAEDVLKIALFPLTYLAMQASACFGLLSPNNGRKLYASFARIQYGDQLPERFESLGIRKDDLEEL